MTGNKTMADDLRDSDLREFALWMLGYRKRFRVTGYSMMPILKPGDEVLIQISAYQKENPQLGHIVVARHPYRRDVILIKRVIEVLAEGRCQLQGDCPSESTDSRSFGSIPLDHLIGRVTSRFTTSEN